MGLLRTEIRVLVSRLLFANKTKMAYGNAFWYAGASTLMALENISTMYSDCQVSSVEVWKRNQGFRQWEYLRMA